METHDSTSIPPSAKCRTQSERLGPRPAPQGGRERPIRSGFRLWALGAGAGAALVSWLLIEATLDSFKPKGSATRHGVRRS